MYWGKISYNLSLAFFASMACAQVPTVQRVSDTKKIELNKSLFIGKPLSYLLSKIQVPIKSALFAPNKNKHEINTLCIRYVEQKEFRRQSYKDMSERPTQLVITFDQNWDVLGRVCRVIDDPKCAEWTKEDEKNLGDLIVYDVYVLGKN